MRLLSSLSEEEQKKHLAGLQEVLTEEEKANPNLINEILVDDEIPVAPDDYCQIAGHSVHEAATTPIFFYDKFGVGHIYPEDTGKPKAVYMDLNSNDFNGKFTNVSYGHNSHLPNTKKTEGGITFFNTVGSPITYNSGNPPGRSVRLDFQPNGEIWGDESKCKGWADKPDFLCSADDMRDAEFTIYIRPHGKLGKHMACAAKMQGRRGEAGDKNRCVIEMLYPEDTHPKVAANVNYDHFPYEAVKGVVQYFTGDMLTDNVWVGLKWCYKVTADKKSVTIELWVDTTPFDANGKPTNNWRLKGVLATFTGTPGYKNIPPIWAFVLYYLRVDGWKSLDFTFGSLVAIILNALPPQPPGPTPNPTPTPTPNPNPQPTPTEQEPTKEEDIVATYLSKNIDKFGSFILKVANLISKSRLAALEQQFDDSV